EARSVAERTFCMSASAALGFAGWFKPNSVVVAGAEAQPPKTAWHSDDPRDGSRTAQGKPE
ncbi:MAG: hypothetical protein ABI556_13145, partial [Gemmatimonadales bacterium]